MFTGKMTRRRRLSLETLENRQMMTIDLAGALAVALVADSLSDDRFENNDSMSRPAELGTVTASRTISDLKMRDAQDWYRFRIGESFTGGSVQITFLHSNGDLDVRLVNSAGNEVGRSTGSGNVERISLANLPAGQYYVKVYGCSGAYNRDYSLTINPGLPTQPTVSVPSVRPLTTGNVVSPTDDRYENNDTRTGAAALGLISSEQTVSNLQMRDQHDWFRFRMNGPGRDGDFVRINFLHSQGDLDVELVDSFGRSVGSSTGTGNAETISLANLAAGEYSVHVYGFRGVQNPQYSLTIRPGVATSPAVTSQPVTTARPSASAAASAGNAGSALPWSGIPANGVNLLNSILGPLPTTFAAAAQDPFVQQFTAPRDPRFDNGLGYLPWTATSSLVNDLLRSNLAQFADPMDVLMFGGTRPGIYYAVQDQIAKNFATGSTAIDVSGVNHYYGIGDGNLDLLAQVSHGYLGPQTPGGQIPLPLFQQWGWGAPIS